MVTNVSAMPLRHSSGALAVGVDLGGTWIRAVALRGGRRVARVSARVTRSGDVRSLLVRVWRRRGWTATRVSAVVVASRGIWTAGECRTLARRLRGLSRRTRVIPDAQAAALGALDDRPGVLVLSGTGSIVVGHDGRGRWARAGGFGPLLGDEGSGFWLGREWVRATAGKGDFQAIRALAHSPNPVAAIAALAPVVIARARRGDRRALRIVGAGQRHLASWTFTVARGLGLRPPIEMSWAGSVLGDAWFRAGVAHAIAERGLRARWHPPAAEPVLAAARLAARLAGAQAGVC